MFEFIMLHGFKLSMLAGFIYAVYWAWRRQVYVYPCYVCGKGMKYNHAACSDRCAFELYRDSEEELNGNYSE